jgi:2-aminoadipate transaminase
MDFVCINEKVSEYDGSLERPLNHLKPPISSQQGAAMPDPHTPATQYPFAERMNNVKPSFVREILKVTTQPNMISFAGGLPAPELFDIEGMKQATIEVFDQQGRIALQYSMTDGMARLRENLIELMKTRGAHGFQVDDFIITNGSQQGIDLIAKIMLDPGDIVVIERPSYLAAVQVFDLYQARYVGIEVDDHGMVVDDLEQKLMALHAQGKHAKFIYTVATFSNPTGGTLGVERRKKLLELAVKYQTLILEDDPYSDLRFAGEPVPPIIGLRDQVPGSEHWCVYLSTLSKILAPGLRVAWMILPQAIRQKVLVAKQASDLHTSTFNQLIASRYLESGRLQHNLPRIRDAYGSRGHTMMHELERLIPGNVMEFNRPEGGMFLWARMNEGVDTMQLVQKAIQANVVFVPGQPFYAGDPKHNLMRISFSAPTPDEIKEGVKRLAEAILD